MFLRWTHVENIIPAYNVYDAILSSSVIFVIINASPNPVIDWKYDINIAV